jgi:hypothetical protein
MASDSKALAGAEHAMTRTKAYTMVTLNRSMFSGVEYNPRTITPEAHKRLRDNLNKIGQVAPCSVNHRTLAKGWPKDEYVILSGHQRIAAIDALEGRDDYDIEVSVVELSPADEKTQNVFLNNKGAQGMYDFDILHDLMAEFQVTGVNMADTGFTTMEVGELFPDLAVDIPTMPLAVDDTTKAEITSSLSSKTGKKGSRHGRASEGDSGGVQGGQATPPHGTPEGATEGATEGQQGASTGASPAPQESNPAAAYAAKKRENTEDGKADNLAIFVFSDAKHCQEFRDMIGAGPGERYFKGDLLIGWLKQAARSASSG